MSVPFRYIVRYCQDFNRLFRSYGYFIIESLIPLIIEVYTTFNKAFALYFDINLGQKSF